MKTIREIAEEQLLKGERINKGEFHSKYGTFTLTQRIEEIRKDGWDVRSRPIPGKRGMVEYWLEPTEIQRIKSAEYKPKKQEDEQQPIENSAETPLKDNEQYEQLGIGLIGGANYTERW